MNRLCTNRTLPSLFCLLRGAGFQRHTRCGCNAISLRFVSSSGTWRNAKTANAFTNPSRPLQTPNPVVQPEYDFQSLINGLKQKFITGKQFYETENEGIRASLLLLPQYRGMFSAVPTRVGERPPSIFATRESMMAVMKSGTIMGFTGLLSCFSGYLSLAKKQILEDELFLEFVQAFSDKLNTVEKMNFAELQGMLQTYQRFKFENFPHDYAPAHILRAAIDLKCLQNSSDLTLSQKFILSDLWYLSSCSRLAEFPQFFISNIKPEVAFFKSHEVVRLLFALCLQRTADPGLMLLIERVLLPYIQSFTLDEIGAVCAGFFKTQTTPGVELVDKILNRLLSPDVDFFDGSVSVAAFSKFFNRYAVGSHDELLEKLLSKLKPQLAQFTTTSLAHVLAMHETIESVDEDFVLRVCKLAKSKFPDVRMKDLAKICQTCAFFNLKPKVYDEDFLTDVVQMLENNLKLEEVSLYPTSFVELLLALAQVEIFSPKLLRVISDQTFLKVYEDLPKSVLNYEALLALHYAVEFDFPERSRPILPETDVQRILQNGVKRPPTHSSVLSILEGVQTLFEKNKSGNVKLMRPLPYAEEMVVVRMKDLQPLPIPAELEQSGRIPHLIKPPQDNSCVVLMYSPWWLSFKPGQQLVGSEQTKIRHLKALGYQVINILQPDVQNFNFIQKTKFLRDKLFFNDFGNVFDKPVDSKIVNQTSS